MAITLFDASRTARRATHGLVIRPMRSRRGYAAAWLRSSTAISHPPGPRPTERRAGAPVVNEAVGSAWPVILLRTSAKRGPAISLSRSPTTGRNSGAWAILLPGPGCTGRRRHGRDCQGCSGSCKRLSADRAAILSWTYRITAEMASCTRLTFQADGADVLTWTYRRACGSGGTDRDCRVTQRRQRISTDADGATTAAANAQSAIEDHERTTT